MCRVTVANPDSGRQAKRRQKNQPGERIASQLLSPKGGEMTNTEKEIIRVLSGNWKEQLRKLPKYQIKEIIKSLKIYKHLEYFKWDAISFSKLKKELKKIIKDG